MGDRACWVGDGGSEELIGKVCVNYELGSDIMIYLGVSRSEKKRSGEF